MEWWQSLALLSLILGVLLVVALSAYMHSVDKQFNILRRRVAVLERQGMHNALKEALPQPEGKYAEIPPPPARIDYSQLTIQEASVVSALRGQLRQLNAQLTDKSQNLEEVTRSGAQMALDLQQWQAAFAELRRRVPGLAPEEHYWNGSLMRDLLEEREERLAAEKVAKRKERMEQG